MGIIASITGVDEVREHIHSHKTTSQRKKIEFVTLETATQILIFMCDLLYLWLYLVVPSETHKFFVDCVSIIHFLSLLQEASY